MSNVKFICNMQENNKGTYSEFRDEYFGIDSRCFVGDFQTTASKDRFAV